MSGFIVFISMILFFGLTPCFAQEQLTITTYYPSPYGSYNELRSKRMAIGDNYYQGGDYDWGDEIDADADLVVEGNVGIGTPSPGAKLEVNGQVKITGGSPGAGKVLTSDASGVASWQAVAGCTITFSDCSWVWGGYDYGARYCPAGKVMTGFQERNSYSHTGLWCCRITCQ